MGVMTYRDANEFLGNDAVRYFAKGHRHFEWRIMAFEVGDNQLWGELKIGYVGPARPGGTPHLGSIEYTAIASMLAEYVLVYLMKLDAEQVSLSLLRRIRLKLRSAIEIQGGTTLVFRCAPGQPECTRHASNGMLSPISVVLAGTEVSLVADHPARRWGRFDPWAAWPVNQLAMHNHGYKERANSVKHIVCDPDRRVCTALVTRVDDYRCDRRGLFTARDTTVPTDVLAVTGQLMQILLYTLEGTTREACGNIWLRAMDIRYERPVWAMEYAVNVSFLDMKTLVKGGHTWRTVRLESRLGGISGTFDITHQLRKTR